MSNKKQKKLISIIFLAILLTSLWSASGLLDLIDAQDRARVAHQLVTERRLVVDSFGEDGSGSTFRDQKGSYTSKFGIGQTIFFLPFDAIATVVTQNLTLKPELKERIYYFILSVPVFWLSLAINFWLCLKILAKLKQDRFTAYFISFVAIFGSTFWQMAKQGQEEIQLSILLLFSLYNFLCWKRDSDNKYVWLSAVCTAATLIFRPTALPIPLGVAGLYIYEISKKITQPKQVSYIRILIPFAITNFCAIAIVAAYNLFKTGNPLKTGYLAEESFSGYWVNGIVEPIIGMDKGIIWTNPWLLPCFIFTCFAWKHLKQDLKVLSILSLFLFTSSVLIYCKWISWAGDDTYGARFQVHLVPLFCLTFGTATLIYIKTYFYKGLSTTRYKLLALGCGFILFLLQIPSIALVNNLERYQAAISNAISKSRNGSPTGALGQVRLRYANFFSKLTTGEPVKFPEVNTSKGLPSALQDAVRWNFWAWLAEKRFGHIATLLKLLWVLIVLASIVCWVLAFRMLVYSK